MPNLCINARCPKPENLETQLFCQGCGSELLLGGRYRVLSELGGGGFGKTYEVTATHQTETMLLKVLINPQEKAIELFQREAQVLSKLNDPGIPQVPEDGYFTYFLRDAQEPLHCLVMEKIEGMDLAEYMRHRDRRPMEVSVATRWLTEIVEILKTVHSQQFFHRDIKPANIMLRSSGALALIDFGTVREISATYVSKQGMGQVTGVVSAGYTAPEQLNGQAVLQSDFFALGRTFVFLLTGKEPADLYDAYQDAVVWRELAPHVPIKFADLVDSMMARAIRDRPQSAADILNRLSSAPPSQSVSTSTAPRPVDPTEVIPRVESTPPPLSMNQPVSLMNQSQESSPPESVQVQAPDQPSEGFQRSTLFLDQADLVKWVFANIGGFTVAELLTGDSIDNPLLLAISGAVIGGGQWIVLREKIKQSWRWPLAYAVCSGASVGVWLFLFAGLLLACVQWFMLRPYLSKAAWWIAISLVSVLVTFVSVFILVGLQVIDSEGILITVIGSVVYGITTGFGLHWLSKESISQA